MIAANHLRVGEAVELFLEHQRRHFDTGDGISRQWNNVASGLRKWVVPIIGERWLFELNSTVTHSLVESWIDSRKLGISTINRYIGFVHELARYCEIRGHITPAQLASILNVRRLRAGRFGMYASDPIRPLDLDLVKATLATMEPQMARAIRLLLLTGMRPIELRRMTLADLYEARWEGEPAIVYKPSRHKTAHHGKRKTIAMVREAATVLREQLTSNPPATDSPGFVFSREGLGFAMMGDPAIRKAIREAVSVAGLEHWTPYRLRHTHASVARANGVAMQTISTSLGHSSTRTTEIYAEQPDQEAIRAALDIKIQI